MSVKLANCVQETSATTGTGALSLANAAPAGAQTFGSRLSDGDLLKYKISNQSAAGEWEVGYGQYNSSGPTLTRLKVIDSSNAGAIVSFSAGTKDVILTVDGGQFEMIATLIWGHGSDGAKVIGAATTFTLDRDYNWTSLTFANPSTSKLVCNGWQAYVNGVVDIRGLAADAISNAPAGAPDGAAGLANGNGGAIGAWVQGQTVGSTNGSPGGIGGVGTNTTGGQGGGGQSAQAGLGGNSGASGAGGTGSSGANAGGALQPLVSVAGQVRLNGPQLVVAKGTTMLPGGTGGGGGGAGGGSGSAPGAGGGAGGAGGNVMRLPWRFIWRDATSAVGCISNRAGKGGNGGTTATNACGGGGGGAGAGGGAIIVMCEELFGSTATSCITCPGGTGGNGGNGQTTGAGGPPGEGGAGGWIRVNLMSRPLSSFEVVGSAAGASTAASGTTGGTGGTGGACVANL